MNELCKVSVIVPTYRRETELCRALNSLSEQTFSDFEIVVVDDNDQPEWNEKVESIIESFQKQHPSTMVTYIANHPNLGSAKARNVGIEASTGEYVCFLDDDDIYYPKRIENQFIPMKAKGADYGVTNIALYSESEKLIEVRKREYIKETTQSSLLKYHLMHHITGTDTMMFRREYLMKIGCFSPVDIGDEFYLMQKAIECGGKFLHVPVCDVKAYVHMGEGGLSSGSRKIDGENCLYAYKEQYFYRLDKKSIRYIKMRHNVVLAYAYLRVKKYFMFFIYGIKGFIFSPIEALQILNK